MYNPGLTNFSGSVCFDCVSKYVSSLFEVVSWRDETRVWGGTKRLGHWRSVFVNQTLLMWHRGQDPGSVLLKLLIVHRRKMFAVMATSETDSFYFHFDTIIVFFQISIYLVVSFSIVLVSSHNHNIWTLVSIRCLKMLPPMVWDWVVLRRGEKNLKIIAPAFLKTLLHIFVLFKQFTE